MDATTNRDTGKLLEWSGLKEAKALMWIDEFGDYTMNNNYKTQY